MDLVRLARYPFLPDAASYMEKEGPALQELLTERIYAAARESGRQRVAAALEDSTRPAPAAHLADPTPRALLESLLSYLYARILVSALNDAYVVRRHALAEAVRVKTLLDAEEPRVVAACAQALGLAFEAEGDGLRAHFTEYLRYAVHLKDAEWKLVSQPLGKGMVHLTVPKAARLAQEALRRRIESELPRKLAPEVAKAVEADAAPLREMARIRKEKYEVQAFGKVDLALLPPCMSAILAQLQRGENAAHNARFAIVTFLHRIGMTPDEIIALFAQAPDFREDLTRYQVEHITGVTSGTVYNVPGCDNLQTFNLCHADDLCRTRTRDGNARVRYPGDYYRYLAEAKPFVEALAAVLPLAHPERLVRAGAMNFRILKELEIAARDPILPYLDPAAVVRIVQERKLPTLVVEGKLVVDEAHPADVLRILESEWVRKGALRSG